MRFSLLLPCLLLAACAPRVALESHLTPIRSIEWQSDVVEPEPDWNPSRERPRVIARCRGGFIIFEEGERGDQRFAAEDRHETFYPRWLNPDQAVFGPAQNVQLLQDGTIVQASDGLTVVTITDEGKLERRQLADRGYMPKPGGGGLVWAQVANRIIAIDSKGGIEDFGEGFDAEPQSAGPGLCWRDVPAFDHDWWTGKPAPGTMFVRWKPKSVDAVPGGVQASWTRLGGVVVCVLNAPAPAGKPWWSAGTRLVHVPAPGATPVELYAGARDPQAHPLADLLAWTADDGVWIGTIRPDGWKERIAPSGRRPRWSSDGLRLCWLDDGDGSKTTPVIKAVVLAPTR